MNNNSQKNYNTGLKEVQDDCDWLVSIGAIDKSEACQIILSKAMEILNGLKMNIPVVNDEEWILKEYGYMGRLDN